MQIKALKFRYMKPCANKSIPGNNNLDIKYTTKSMLNGMYDENVDQI